MRRITSKQNNIIKETKKLHEGKYRNKEGLYIIEGKKLIDEALTTNAEVKYVISRDDDLAGYDEEGSLVGKLYRVSDEVFSSLSDTQTPQGMIAVVKKKGTGLRGDKLLVLDRVQDPGNVGTLIRSAAATGFDIVSIKGSADLYSPKVVRATAGALFHVNIDYAEDDKELFSILKGYKLLVTDSSGLSYRDIDYSGKIAIVVGNEGSGVGEAIIKKADKIAGIPMQNNVESLNAAVAGSILMFETIKDI